MVLKNPSDYEKDRTIVFFVRHGDREHKEGKPGIGFEHPGPGLSMKGKKQAKEVAKEFAKIKDEIDEIYVSTMSRAIETAEEISSKINKKARKVHELCEFNQILWKRVFWKRSFWKHFKKYKQASRAFDKILEKNKKKVIVVVCHGNVIKGLVGNKLGLSLKQIGAFDYHNCHITRVRFKGKKLSYINYFNSKGLV